MVRAVTTREPEWDEKSQAEMLALALYRSYLCPRCHHDMRRTTLPDNDGNYQGSAVRCHACAAIDAAASAHTPAKGEDKPASLLYRADWRADRRR